MQFTSLISRIGIKSAAGKLWARPLVDAAIGVVLCGIAAAGASAVAAGHSWKNAVPLVFTLVLLVIAGLFGTRVGILSTVLAAVIFSGFLFAPARSLAVAGDSARSNLGWMLLIGIGFSFLFAPPTSGLRRH
jgi:K+-sensing histidine kinase KdpD